MTSLRTALAVSCMLMGSSPLHAQVGAGAITGLVRDPAGQAVPGATVVVTEMATSRQRVLVSTGDGVYTAPSLAPGTYQIDVSLQGFRPCGGPAFASPPARRPAWISSSPSATCASRSR